MSAPLAYASGTAPRRRRVSAFSLVAFMLSMATPGGVWLAAQGRTHDELCPECGGHFTRGAIAAAVVLLAVCAASLLRAAFRGASAVSIIMSAAATALAALLLAAVVGFHFAIQA